MFLCASCGDKNTTPDVPDIPEKPDVKPEPEPEPEPEDWSWVNGYPKGVTVEEFEDVLSDGKKCLGFIATIDFKANPNLTFNCMLAKGKKKPSQFFADFSDSKKTACLAVNAGYFAFKFYVQFIQALPAFFIALCNFLLKRKHARIAFSAGRFYKRCIFFLNGLHFFLKRTFYSRKLFFHFAGY